MTLRIKWKSAVIGGLALLAQVLAQSPVPWVGSWYLAHIREGEMFRLRVFCSSAARRGVEAMRSLLPGFYG